MQLPPIHAQNLAAYYGRRYWWCCWIFYYYHPVNLWRQHLQVRHVRPSKDNTYDKGRQFPLTNNPNLTDCYYRRCRYWMENSLNFLQTTSSWQFFLWFWKSEQKYEVSISNKMWQNDFRSNPESNNIFLHFTFQLRTWFIFCFFLYVVIIHLIWRGECVGIYCKLIPDWIESTQAWI